MADAVTSQKLIDTLHRTAYKFTNISDGDGESDVKKVDLSAYRMTDSVMYIEYNPCRY